MNWDHITRVIELILISGGVGLLWRGVRALSRFTVHLEEYPLHRHVGREILYPKGLAPEETERLREGVSV